MTEKSNQHSKLVYVIPHLSRDECEHFAHIPALLAELGKNVDVIAVVERGAPPARLDGVRDVVKVTGRTRAGRLLSTVNVIRRCSAAGYDTYFLRYSQLFLAALVVTRPFFRHRILLWRSGISDVVQPELRRSLRHRLQNAINRAQLRFVHRFVTGPESMVTYMSRRWRVPLGKMCLLYNDVDTKRFTPLPLTERKAVRTGLGWREDEFVILFVHRLSYRKGARLLAPLLHSLLSKADFPVRLVVVGDGPERARIEQSAADPALRGRMQLMGALPNHHLPKIYGAADCLLMPSLEEGFPRVLLEAMSAALPVVSTNAGGSVDVLSPHYPFVAGVGDVSGLVHHLMAVAQMSTAEREALGARLRARVQANYSTENVAAMLQGLL
ncbi:glycosyltransferase family 4 protein [Nonomuraea sp. SYSU D8015]|uniref:glycosyltransferase family 4 protein n=1 Tax=Nonomuraea sp. SYSU D8015 TaxID=2593644 RepID=UPI001660ABF7|nr:glycosyltransferase family 4 protein [Nonomuraea sp. SYSU D8015]